MEPRISLCMIVKNEEDWITRSVGSVAPLVDEIILVDTGSTDRTLERARSFHPRIVRWEWTGHFADARNVSLDAATGSWILVLDADECIARRDLPRLREAARGPAAGYHLIQRNYVNHSRVHGWQLNDSDYAEGKPYRGYVDNPLIRFFRNDPEIRFRGAVHEIVDPGKLPETFRFGSLPVVLHHYGKVCGDERVQAKRRLYKDLGLKKLEEDPGNAKAWMDLAIQLQELGEYAESREYCRKSFQLGGPAQALLYLASAEKHLKRYPEALDALNSAQKQGLDTFELHLERGNVLLALGKPEKALEAYKKSLERRFPSPLATFNIGMAYRKLGRHEKAVTYYERARQLDPEFVEAGVELASIHTEAGRVAAARNILEDLLRSNPDRREIRLARAKVAVIEDDVPKALELTEGSNDDDAVALALRGAAHAASGDAGNARRCLLRAIEIDPGQVDARINLSHILAAEGRFELASEHLAFGYDKTRNPSLLAALGVYEARAGLLDEALPHLDAALAAGVATRDHWICRALILERKNMASELSAHYRAMMRELPDLRGWVEGRLETAT